MDSRETKSKRKTFIVHFKINGKKHITQVQAKNKVGAWAKVTWSLKVENVEQV